MGSFVSGSLPENHILTCTIDRMILFTYLLLDENHAMLRGQIIAGLRQRQADNFYLPYTPLLRQLM